MATRTIHRKQPLAQRSKTFREMGSVTSLHKLPRWQKYLKFGTIAEELGKEQAATMWRRRAYCFLLDRDRYSDALAIAGIYLTKKEAAVANSLALLSENVSSGRTNGELRMLVANAMRAGAPLDLIKWGISRTRFYNPQLSYNDWKNNCELSYRKVS